MSAYFAPLHRNEWTVDKEGVPTTAKHDDASRKYSFDYTDMLPSGVTISTSVFTASGVTTSGAALATPVATVTVTGTDGSIENTLTLSNGEIRVLTYRFVGVPEGRGTDDYGNG